MERSSLMGYVLLSTENNEGEKVQTVIGRTGEVRIIDTKNDRLMISNNIPYGATLIGEGWTKNK